MNSEIPQENPYMFISKKNGQITGILDISFEKIISNIFRKPVGKNGVYSAMLSYNALIKNENDHIIGDISSDTIYSYSGRLKPLLIRKPSVSSMETPIVLTVDLKSPNYFFFTTTKMEYDIETNIGFPFKEIAYDYQQQKFFEYTLINNEFPLQKVSFGYGGTDANKIFYAFISSEELIEEYKKGKVYGKLKEIAPTLKDDDNPILMKIKFKE